MRCRYSAGRPHEAWRMLDRALTETATAPSKAADTSEPARVTVTPVVLNVSWPGRGETDGEPGAGTLRPKTWGGRGRGGVRLRGPLGGLEPGDAFPRGPEPSPQDTPSSGGLGRGEGGPKPGPG